MYAYIEAEGELTLDQLHEVALLADANNKHGYPNHEADNAIEFALSQWAQARLAPLNMLKIEVTG